MTSRVSMSEALAVAVRFLVPAWGRAWGALAIAIAVLSTVLALRLWSPLSPWRTEGLLAAAAALMVLQGGLYRLALGKGGAGPAGLGLGLDRLRIGAVWGLMAAFLFVLGLLAFVVILCFAFAVASSGHGFVVAQPSTWASAVDGRGRVVVETVGALCLFGLIWAGTRVSLGAAATVDEGKVLMLSSWPNTRGHVVSLISARLCLGLAPVGLAALALGQLSPTPGAVGGLDWAAGVAAAALLAGLWLPLDVGLAGYFYQRRPEI